MSAPRPTLDLIVADPRTAANLPRETLNELLAEIAVAQSTLVARLLALDGTAAKVETPAPADDDWISADEAAAIIKHRRRWIYDNKDKLPFVSKVSHKVLLCSKAGILKWLQARKVRR
jgi:hypothetical protein